MTRVKDIEALRSPGLYKDKPEPNRQNPHLKLILYTLLTISTIFILYQRWTASDSSCTHPITGKQINWSRYAYSQYATDQHYLCNSLMVFASLHALHSRADRILFYPKTWDTDVSSSKDRTSQLLVMARDKYHVKLRPVEMYTLKRSSPSETETWDASINKLHAFREAEYDRIIHLDSDITLQQHLDELFFLPRTTVAMPRAYWKLNEPDQNEHHKLTSLIVVLEPSAEEAEILWDTAAGLDNSSSTTSNGLFDMELLNSRYGANALVLPHRGYALVTGEFRRTGGMHNHSAYFGNSYERWDPQTALKEAKIVHFSDWPLPKPWIMWPNSLLREVQPECEFSPGTPDEHGCENRVVWRGLYDDFRRRRKEVCALLSVPAPDWPPKVRKKKPTAHEGST